MTDIICSTNNHIFTYRVAGILIDDGKVLLQSTSDASGFAFPGGHVEFGETGEQALLREFKEEMDVDIEVKGLEWVNEVFFSWGGKPCQQICFYYRIVLKIGKIPLTGQFYGEEYCPGRQENIEFHWIPLAKSKDLVIYPSEAPNLLRNIGKGIKHFISRKE